jgi:hypothetical protein
VLKKRKEKEKRVLRVAYHWRAKVAGRQQRHNEFLPQ